MNACKLCSVPQIHTLYRTSETHPKICGDLFIPHALIDSLSFLLDFNESIEFLQLLFIHSRLPGKSHDKADLK